MSSKPGSRSSLFYMACTGLKGKTSHRHIILLWSVHTLYSLCDDEIKARECVSDATSVSQTDAFDERRQTQVVVEVVAITTARVKLCQSCVHMVENRVKETLTACNDSESVPHVHHLLHSTVWLTHLTHRPFSYPHKIPGGFLEFSSCVRICQHKLNTLFLTDMCTYTYLYS